MGKTKVITIRRATRTVEQIEEIKMEIESDYTQVYDNICEASKKMKTVSAFHLRDWLITQVAESNTFLWNKKMKNKFRDSGYIYSDKTLKAAMAELLNVGILIRPSGVSKTEYILNPAIFWQDETKVREALLASLEESKIETNPVKIQQKRLSPIEGEVVK
jgi:hypothetical protein